MILKSERFILLGELLAPLVEIPSRQSSDKIINLLLTKEDGKELLDKMLMTFVPNTRPARNQRR